MRSEELLTAALETVELPVKYYEYNGTKQEYIVYNEEAEQPANYGDNRPQHEIFWWQVHIFAPKESRFRDYRKAAVHHLDAAGFTVTDVMTLYESETRTIHVVISCHMAEERED